MKQITILCFLVLLCFLTTNLRAQETDSLQASSTLKRGIYLSLDELYNNSPSITDSFVLSKKERVTENWEGTYSYTPKYIGIDQEVRSIIGFCDGERQFIHYYDEFFEIEKNTRNYGFWSYGTYENNEKKDGRFIKPFIFRTKFEVSFFVRIESLKDVRSYYILEPTNDKVYSKENYQQVGLRLAIYRNAKREKAEGIEVVINDSLEFNLVPNSYYEPVFKIGSEEIKVCIEGQEDCLFFYPDSIAIKYLKVSNVQNVILEEVDWNQGEYETIVPFKKQRKRNGDGSRIDFGTF